MKLLIISVSATLLLLTIIVDTSLPRKPIKGFVNCDVITSFQTSEYGQSMGVFQCDRADGVVCYFTSSGGAACK